MSAVDVLPDAAAVIDATGRVLATNAAFRRSARRQTALHVCNRVLQAAHPESEARFAERLAAAVASGRERALRVPVHGSADPLELRIVPLPERDTALVIVHDATSARSVCVERLRDLYDLTRAQAELAARLADGASLEGAAAQLGVSLNTVRTHLRLLFAKCGVSTQAALLQRLALGAARIGSADGARLAGDDDPVHA